MVNHLQCKESVAHGEHHNTVASQPSYKHIVQAQPQPKCQLTTLDAILPRSAPCLYQRIKPRSPVLLPRRLWGHLPRAAPLDTQAALHNALGRADVVKQGGGGSIARQPWVAQHMGSTGAPGRVVLEHWQQEV